MEALPQLHACDLPQAGVHDRGAWCTMGAVAVVAEVVLCDGQAVQLLAVGMQPVAEAGCCCACRREGGREVHTAAR